MNHDALLIITASYPPRFIYSLFKFMIRIDRINMHHFTEPSFQSVLIANLHWMDGMKRNKCRVMSLSPRTTPHESNTLLLSSSTKSAVLPFFSQITPNKLNAQDIPNQPSRLYSSKLLSTSPTSSDHTKQEPWSIPETSSPPNIALPTQSFPETKSSTSCKP